MDPQAARHSIPEDNLVTSDDNESIKNISQGITQLKNVIVIITKCLSHPCPVYYTDTLSESILIECKDPCHHQNEPMSYPNSSFKYNKKEAGTPSAHPNKADIERLGTKPQGKSWNI